MGDDWTKPRDVGPTQKTQELAEEAPSPQRHKGKRKKESVENKSTINTISRFFHSAYRG